MRRQAVLGCAMSATIATAGAAAGPARADTAQPATARCAVVYSDPAVWSGGFLGQISITLTGFQAGLGWQFSFNFTSPQQRITLMPNEQWSQVGENVVVTNQPQATPTDGTLRVSFVGSYGTDTGNPHAENFTFDGVACTQAS